MQYIRRLLQRERGKNWPGDAIHEMMFFPVHEEHSDTKTKARRLFKEILWDCDPFRRPPYLIVPANEPEDYYL